MFCYLGDMICCYVGSSETVSTRIGSVGRGSGSSVV